MSSTKSFVPFEFQTGGSLKENHPTYVERLVEDDNKCIRTLEDECIRKLKKGIYCCVFSFRQSGKSSLRHQIVGKLKQDAICLGIDLTRIGIYETANGWCNSLIRQLIRELNRYSDFDFDSDNFITSYKEFNLSDKISQLIEEILVSDKLKRSVFIFIDEIDYLYDFPFDTDEFFTLIRAFYNRRAEDEKYNRLTFCLLGVTTPSDLIIQKNNTRYSQTVL